MVSILMRKISTRTINDNVSDLHSSQCYILIFKAHNSWNINPHDGNFPTLICIFFEAIRTNSRSWARLISRGTTYLESTMNRWVYMSQLVEYQHLHCECYKSGKKKCAPDWWSETELLRRRNDRIVSSNLAGRVQGQRSISAPMYSVVNL